MTLEKVESVTHDWMLGVVTLRFGDATTKQVNVNTSLIKLNTGEVMFNIGSDNLVGPEALRSIADVLEELSEEKPVEELVQDAVNESEVVKDSMTLEH